MYIGKPPMHMTKFLLSKGTRHSSRPHKQDGTGIWNRKEQQNEVAGFLWYESRMYYS